MVVITVWVITVFTSLFSSKILLYFRTNECLEICQEEARWRLARISDKKFRRRSFVDSASISQKELEPKWLRSQAGKFLAIFEFSWLLLAFSLLPHDSP